ncbi:MULTISPECIES: acyltransferase family protein [Microbacterium]|uniref:Acyltransferase family protein n=1 Tax=Microbacterium trichothecenolyticum TaxID=69370 RepID=A0A0M2HDS2_MICTR|nr:MULTISPECIES: acyltransferase [Microbacterium]KJL42392.1 Acyltransferase family protein [Microbacterium trichothecenolyticum]MDR7190139.1 peptidoglycan/LPS O-acetylase OafA/YrhL [Microbacterium sp. BE35]
MTIVRIAAAASPRIDAPVRDRAIDLVRTLCIAGVVVLHAMMVGVAVTDAGPSFVNASDGTWWIVPLSWLLQVMPLFFVMGGFSGATALRRARRRGRDGIDFVGGRIHRLLLPALVTIATVGALLALLTAAGVPAELVALAGFRFAQPLWFLGVFLVCQALLPALLRLHESAPVRTITILAAAAGVVDLVRLSTGVDAYGFLNLAFVWLALQQLGFFLADGRIDALSRRLRVMVAAAATAALAISFVAGVHSPDLVANINPPTTALLFVGIAHTALFSLLRGRLEGLAERPAPARLIEAVTPRAMTVYLWHMPVLLCLAGLTAVGAMITALPLPGIDGPWWWLSRPAWLALALAATAVVAWPLARIEAVASPRSTRSAWRLGLATGAGTAAVALLLVSGTNVLTAAAAAALLVAALRLARAPQPWARRSRTADPSIIRGSRPRTCPHLPLG